MPSSANDDGHQPKIAGSVMVESALLTASEAPSGSAEATLGAGSDAWRRTVDENARRDTAAAPRPPARAKTCTFGARCHCRGAEARKCGATHEAGASPPDGLRPEAGETSWDSAPDGAAATRRTTGDTPPSKLRIIFPWKGNVREKYFTQQIVFVLHTCGLCLRFENVIGLLRDSQSSEERDPWHSAEQVLSRPLLLA